MSIDLIITLCIGTAGILHLLPLSGVLGAKRLVALYQLDPLDLAEPNLQILLRHRAVLFGLLGVFLLYCAGHPALQLTGVGAGLISVVSFIVIARSVGHYNSALRKVVIADVIAAICLLLALGLIIMQAQSSG